MRFQLLQLTYYIVYWFSNLSHTAILIVLNMLFSRRHITLLLLCVPPYKTRNSAISTTNNYTPTHIIISANLRNVKHLTGLHNKLLKPLAQGASRFEELLARKKSYWPEKKSLPQILETDVQNYTIHSHVYQIKTWR